ncbi:hypothetical protein [Pseudomonas sp. LB3P31]
MGLFIENDTSNGEHEFGKKGLKRAVYQSNFESTAHAGKYRVELDIDTQKYQLEADLEFFGHDKPIHIELDVSA